MKDKDIEKIARKDLEHFRRTDGRGNVYGISEWNLKHFARDIEAFVLNEMRNQIQKNDMVE